MSLVVRVCITPNIDVHVTCVSNCIHVHAMAGEDIAAAEWQAQAAHAELMQAQANVQRLQT